MNGGGRCALYLRTLKCPEMPDFLKRVFVLIYGDGPVRLI